MKALVLNKRAMQEVAFAVQCPSVRLHTHAHTHTHTYTHTHSQTYTYAPTQTDFIAELAILSGLQNADAVFARRQFGSSAADARSQGGK